MAENVSKTGAWVDSRTGKLVYVEPEEGRQIVTPGGVITPNIKAALERLAEPVPTRTRERAVAPKAPEAR